MLYIKHMVCQRCIMVVQQILDDLKLDYRRVDLGEIDWKEQPSEQQMAVLKERIEEKGFEMIDDKKTRIINQIKTKIVEMVHYEEETPRFNLSVLLSDALHYEYNYL
ncbi:MAG: AraC family transcriptional regulator, partial [Bacteroidota bacterium]|nr:AraC family transcriptional regulator [Bacteroidota bacterium]